MHMSRGNPHPGTPVFLSHVLHRIFVLGWQAGTWLTPIDSATNATLKA
jgi:hypothetical protein